MHEIRNSGRLVVIATCLLMCLRSHGMTLHSYDLDSLVYMSSQVVEGKIGRQYSTNNVAIWEIKISAVLKGSLKAGQAIPVTALDFFRVSSNSPMFGGEKLKQDDQLFLFLDRAKKVFMYDIPDGAEIYWPAPSGIRFVFEGKALGFAQYNNPGPYLAQLQGAATNNAVPTVAAFREQIRKSIVRVEEWKPLLAREPKSNDVPALLEILRKEKVNGGYPAPHSITEIACSGLVKLHDISALTNALSICNYWWILGGGFATPAGRQFVWSKIMDESESLEERNRWATILSKAGEGNPEEHQLKRIAELAVRGDQNQELQATLLDSLQELEGWRSFGDFGKDPNEPARRGIDEASAILRSFSERTDSQEVKYKIDSVLSQFGVNKAPILSILRLEGKFDGYDAVTRSLTYHYDITVSQQCSNATARIVFRNVKTGQLVTLPPTQDLKVAGGTHTGGMKAITVPGDLPAGHYQVFYEYLEDGEVIGHSRSFEVDL